MTASRRCAIPAPTLKPYQHQADGVRIASLRKRFLFGDECGTGKTITSLLIHHTLGGRTLVVAPKSVANTAWTEDPANWFPEYTVAVVAGLTPDKRRAAIFDIKNDIVVINPENLRKHVQDICEAGFQRVCFDESSKLKNPTSQVSEATLKISRHVPEFYCFSGTPAPNGDHEYFTQMRCIAPSAFGEHYFRFINEYFYTEKITVNGREVIKGHKPKPQKREQFLSVLRKHSRVVRKADCLDLPDKVDTHRVIDLSKEEERAYKLAKEALMLEVKGSVNQIDAGAKAMKLRQLAGGWAYLGDQIHTYGRSKLNALHELLEEIGGEPVIIWADFKHDIKTIEEELGVGRCLRLHGETSRDASEIVAKFRSGECQYVVAHAASAGHGITMVNACHAVYYSVPWSAELYEQSRARIDRAGQKRKMTFHHLISRGTIDHQVLKLVNGKIDASTALMEELKK
jgi:SNF2 family DNA or RNA helicase